MKGEKSTVMRLGDLFSGGTSHSPGNVRVFWFLRVFRVPVQSV
jgi:hypothetical protein